jgi:integrase
MVEQRLTKSAVDRLTADGDSEFIVWDAELPGFGVRVKPSGAKSYVIQYRTRDSGRSRRKTIGRHGPLMSLQQARSIARGLLADAARGRDPVGEHRSRRKSPTISELADRYIEEHAMPKKRAGSIRNDRSILERHILPRLGQMKVQDVEPADIQRLHIALRETPYQANRTIALLSKMFSLSVRWGLRTNNPTEGIEKFHEEARHRWLSDVELKRLTAVLNAHPDQVAADAIRLQLLTGARIGEVLGSTWTDFDLDRGVWTKMSHHTKQKRTEHLPLSSAATELLKAIKEDRGAISDFVFPGRSPKAPRKDLKGFWRSVLATADISDYRIHDNRHTHASHLVSSGMSLAIVGRLLGHTNPSTTQRYAHLADDPLREASEIMGRKFTDQRM